MGVNTDVINGNYVRQQGVFNEGIYYKRQEEPVVYVLRGSAEYGYRNWHFSDELNSYTVKLSFSKF